MAALHICSTNATRADEGYNRVDDETIVNMRVVRGTWTQRSREQMATLQHRSASKWRVYARHCALPAYERWDQTQHVGNDSVAYCFTIAID